VIERVDAGDAVVLVGPDATEVGEAVRDARARGERVGAVVGSPGDPEVRAAVTEMLSELYATAPTIS
jgi:hypothetical protein